jgi:hypothetical protein
MNDGGSDASFSAASASVIEWASVNAVTMPSTGHTASPSRSHGPPPAGVRRITDGSSRHSRNSTWS